MNKCPKCHAEYKTGETECRQCGIIFKKHEALKNKKRNILLIKCNACAKEISKNAVSCPFCGEPNQIDKSSFPINKTTKPSNPPISPITLLIIAIGLFFFVVFDLHKLYLPALFDKKPKAMSIYELSKLPPDQVQSYKQKFEIKKCKWILREQKRNPGLLIDVQADACRKKLHIK